MIVAAGAGTNGCLIVTANEMHFEGLKIVNPMWPGTSLANGGSGPGLTARYRGPTSIARRRPSGLSSVVRDPAGVGRKQ